MGKSAAPTMIAAAVYDDAAETLSRMDEAAVCDGDAHDRNSDNAGAPSIDSTKKCARRRVEESQDGVNINNAGPLCVNANRRYLRQRVRMSVSTEERQVVLDDDCGDPKIISRNGCSSRS